jgi:hypothetical protein
MEFPNAVDLYNYIKEHDVKKVLDLGTGVGFSASVMALAFKDKGVEDYHIDSVEQFDKCIALANQLIPKELKKNLIIHKSEVAVWSSDTMPYQYFSVYEKVPEGDYDLIINDGPAMWMEKGNFIELPNGTIQKMLLEGKLNPGVKIVYDGRIRSLKLLERYFSENFVFVHLPKPPRDFFVLKRADNPVKVGDDRHEIMKNTTYFKNHENPIPKHVQSTPRKAANPAA